MKRTIEATLKRKPTHCFSDNSKAIHEGLVEKSRKTRPPSSQFALAHSIPFSFLIFYNPVLLGLTQHFHMKSPARSLCCFVFSRCAQRAARSNFSTRTCPVQEQDVHFSLSVAQQFHIVCKSDAHHHLCELLLPGLSKKYIPQTTVFRST